MPTDGQVNRLTAERDEWKARAEAAQATIRRMGDAIYEALGDDWRSGNVASIEHLKARREKWKAYAMKETARAEAAEESLTQILEDSAWERCSECGAYHDRMHICYRCGYDPSMSDEIEALDDWEIHG